MKASIFDSLDSIFIIDLLSSLKLACETNGIHESATLWLLHFFIKKQAAFALNSRIALKSKFLRKCQKEWTLTAYCKVVNCLKELYASDDVIAETDAEIKSFTPPLNKTSIEYLESLWAKVFRGDGV